MGIDRDRERVILYLYGELPEAGMKAFEAALGTDPRLRKILEEEQSLDRTVPKRPGAGVTNQNLRKARASLDDALRRQSRPGRAGALLEWLATLLTPRVLSPAAAVAMLIIGFAVGSLGWPGSVNLISILAPEAATLLDLMAGDDLEITGLRVKAFDGGSGDVTLTFDAAASVSVSANIRSEAVQRLLLATLKGDVDSGERLDTVDMMASHPQEPTVRLALVYALLNDPNPGVRVTAVGALKGLAEDIHVREALRTALLADLNEGVRVEAIDALKPYGDPQTVDVLRAKAEADPNVYVRSEAQRLLDHWRTLTADGA